MEKRVSSRTIKVVISPREVSCLLGKFGEATVPSSLFRKLESATVKKFTDYIALMDEETKVRQVVISTRPIIDAVVKEDFTPKRHAINEQYNALSREESELAESILNKAFDEAGITTYRAIGRGWHRIEPVEVKNGKEI